MYGIIGMPLVGTHNNCHDDEVFYKKITNLLCEKYALN